MAEKNNINAENVATRAIDALIARGDLIPKNEVVENVEIIRKRVTTLFKRLAQKGDYFTPLAILGVGMLKAEDAKAVKSYGATKKIYTESVNDLQNNVTTLKTLMKTKDFKSLKIRASYLRRLEKLADSLENPSNFKTDIVDIYKMLGDAGVNVTDIKTRIGQLEGKCKIQTFFESAGVGEMNMGNNSFDSTNIAMESEKATSVAVKNDFASHFKKIIPQR